MPGALFLPDRGAHRDAATDGQRPAHHRRVLDIAYELERIGDYAKGIAKINLMMGEEPLVKPLVDVPRMAEKARDVLHRAGQLSAVGGA
jgi:hypothetical protein